MKTVVKTLCLALCLAALATPALAGPTCAPSDGTARILASASPTNLHRNWRAPSQIGLGWSLQVERSVRDADGTEYYLGDLYDTRGQLSARNVYVIEREWDCGP